MATSKSSTRLTFLGCYTIGAGGAGEGIVRTRWDDTTGVMAEATMVAATPSPSFLLRHPAHAVLYAANEVSEGQVSAFSVDDDGALRPLGSWPSGGADPCHLTLDTPGQHLLVANYTSGTVTALALDEHGGPTGQSTTVAHSGHSVHPERQKGPHAHMVAPAPGGVLSVDLGADTVFFHPLNPDTGRLGDGEVALRTRPGTGPRHLAGDRAGRLHVVGELDGSLTTYEPRTPGWDEAARVPTSVEEGALPSEIGLSEDGRFIHVANRGPDTLATFSIAGGSPQLVGEVPSGGAWPRHFASAGDFMAVANERSHSVVIFHRDAATGLPTPTGDILSTPSPACVLPW